MVWFLVEICILMKTVALEVSQWWQCFSINGLGVIAKHVQTLHVLKQQKYKNKNNHHTITKANLDLAKTAGYKIQTYTKWWIWVVNNLSRKDPTSPWEHSLRQCNFSKHCSTPRVQICPKNPGFPCLFVWPGDGMWNDHQSDEKSGRVWSLRDSSWSWIQGHFWGDSRY